MDGVHSRRYNGPLASHWLSLFVYWGVAVADLQQEVQEDYPPSLACSRPVALASGLQPHVRRCRLSSRCKSEALISRKCSSAQMETLQHW